MPLQLSTEALQLAAGQHGSAVLALQLVLLLHHLEQLLLQHLQLLLITPVLLQLQDKKKKKKPTGRKSYAARTIRARTRHGVFFSISSTHQLRVLLDDGLQLLVWSVELVQTLHQ